MRALETRLAEFIASGTVSYEDALDVSAHPKELARAVAAVGVPVKAKSHPHIGPLARGVDPISG
jgi:hypothetical protein